MQYKSSIKTIFKTYSSFYEWNTWFILWWQDWLSNGFDLFIFKNLIYWPKIENYYSYSQDYDRHTFMQTEGCLPAGEKWLEVNLIPVAGVAVGVAILQVLGVCFAQNLRSDIHAQRAKWTLWRQVRSTAREDNQSTAVDL